MLQIGDIVKTSYNTGPYRILHISGPHTNPSYVDSLNLRDKAPPSKPHYNMVVVPEHIVIGKERPNDYCYLNGYEPTADSATWRSVWSDDELYISGTAKGIQLQLF
jgi:hypothetical protein